MRYGYCPIQKRVVPVHEIQRESKALDLFIQDEMPETRHPVTGEYFTSKSKFRAVTRALGYEEIGNDYDRGYEPGKRLERAAREFEQRKKEVFIQNYNKHRTYGR